MRFLGQFLPIGLALFCAVQARAAYPSVPPITIWTNGVPVTYAATNLNIIIGSNTVVCATNRNGSVDLQINANAGGSSSGGGGTNFPPVISNGGGQAASTTVTVGLGVRQNLVIITNASFQLVPSGTPNSGESLKITVSNLHTTASIAVTNTVKYAAWASNITVWPSVPPNSFMIYDLFAATNLNNGTMEWILESARGKEMELRAAGPSIVLLTNLEQSVVFASNSWNGASQVVTGAGNGSTNYGITLSSNSVNYFYLGGSNVHIPWIMGAQPGWPLFFTLVVSNDSANPWGFSTAPGTNRFHFLGGANGTNAPGSFTNETLFIGGVADGTNVTLGWARKQPAK